MKENETNSVESALEYLDQGETSKAKDILKKLLVHDSKNVLAKQLMQRIQDAELEVLKTEASSPQSDSSGLSSQAIEEILGKVKKTFQLKDFDTQLEATVFQNEASRNLFFEKLDQILNSCDLKEWFDLGIGFLEMRLFSVAIHVFGRAESKAIQVSGDSSNDFINAVSLKALAFLESGNPFEAKLRLLQLLSEGDLEPETEIHLYYLLGKATNQLGLIDEARRYFEKVLSIDPNYRDTERMMKELERKS